MAKQTRPYELLIRLGTDGVVAAHVRRLEEVFDSDGTLLGARELPPEPLDLAGPEFGPLVEALNAAILADLRRVTAERDALAARLAATEAPPCP